MNPSLVYIQDTRTFMEQRQNRHCILLSENKASCFVGLDRDLPSQPIAKAELVSHYCLYLLNSDFDIFLSSDLLDHHLSVHDADAIL